VKVTTKLHTACIDAGPGMTFFYHATYAAELNEKIAQYCRENWVNVSDGPALLELVPDNDEEAITMYFASVARETFWRCEDLVTLEIPEVAAVRLDENHYQISDDLFHEFFQPEGSPDGSSLRQREWRDPGDCVALQAAADTNRIWTQVDADSGAWVLTSGAHIINRNYNVITLVPVPDGLIVDIVDDDLEVDEEDDDEIATGIVDVPRMAFYPPNDGAICAVLKGDQVCCKTHRGMVQIWPSSGKWRDGNPVVTNEVISLTTGEFESYIKKS